MKPLLATFAFVGLAAGAIITIASCTTQLLPGNQVLLSNQNVEVIIGDPNAKPPKYVELKHGLADEGKLRHALAKLKRHGGVCEITFLRHDNEPPDPEYCKHVDINLKTDRVIKSAAANNAGSGNSAANDPNLMYRIASPYSSDTTDVLTLLK